MLSEKDVGDFLSRDPQTPLESLLDQYQLQLTILEAEIVELRECLPQSHARPTLRPQLALRLPSSIKSGARRASTRQ